MLFKKNIITVHTENHTKPVNTLCGQNAKLQTVKAGDAHSYRWALNGKENILPICMRGKNVISCFCFDGKA
jgi:hypothetical protein